VVIYNECPARKENYDFTVFWYNLDLADSIYCYQTNSVEGTAASFFKALNNIYTFNSPFPGLLRVHWYQKKTVSGSGISWAICKCAPRSRQTTTPAPHHSSTEQNSNIPVSVISTLLQFHSCQLCIAALKLQTNGREISPLITNTASTQCCWKKWSIVTLQ